MYCRAHRLRAYTTGLAMDVMTNLGCNACMICAWQPQGGSVAHACIARHDVLQSHKHCMAHMQSACDIWRWHGHGEWPASGRFIWLELAIMFPPEAPCTEGFKRMWGKDYSAVMTACMQELWQKQVRSYQSYKRGSVPAASKVLGRVVLADAGPA